MSNFFRNLGLKLQRFMYGRNGFDGFCRFLLISALVLAIPVLFVAKGSPLAAVILETFSFLLLFYCYFRCFSKNTTKRSVENYKYYELRNKFVGLFKREKSDSGYTLFKCPGCKKKIRVPKNRGKLEITCRNCNTTFVRYTGKRK